MTLRDAYCWLFGVLITALVAHLLTKDRTAAADASKRKADALAYLYKWFAKMAAVPTSKGAAPAKPDVVFQGTVGLPCACCQD